MVSNNNWESFLGKRYWGILKEVRWFTGLSEQPA